MALDWNECLMKSPHELVISGPKHAKQLEEEKGLNETVFRIYSLNFLEVSKTSLNVLSPKIKQLENLTALMLYDNKLTLIPKEIGCLKKLKTLDLSNNKIDNLPEELSQLTDLQSHNIIKNNISHLPKDLSKCNKLIVVKISHNKFQEFPVSLCNPALSQHLTEIHATDNEILNLPIWPILCSSIYQLISLLNLSPRLPIGQIRRLSLLRSAATPRWWWCESRLLTSNRWRRGRAAWGGTWWWG